MGRSQRMEVTYDDAVFLVPSSLLCFDFYPCPKNPAPMWEFTDLGGGMGGCQDRYRGDEWRGMTTIT